MDLRVLRASIRPIVRGEQRDGWVVKIAATRIVRTRFGRALLLCAPSQIFLPARGRLPTRPEVPPVTALPPGSATSLDARFAPLQTSHPGQSSFRLVPDGVEAFALRGLMTRAAGRTLDVQYYIWHDDLTGRLLAHELLNAADRGVRVRLLLDDMDAHAHNFGLAALAAHANISVRLFNPYVSRINHRMHNKTWIADNRLAIAGGRNIGDEYFTASR
jgi:cardiolipin synthase C